MNRRGRIPWGPLLRIGAGVALLLLAVRGVDVRLVAGALSQVRIQWVVATLVVVVMATLLKAWRWRLLLTTAVPQATLRMALGPLLVGQALNMIAWARAGDIVRIVSLRRQTQLSSVGIAATVVAEKFIDTLAIGLLAILLVGQTAYISSGGVALTVGVAFVGIVVFAGGARWGQPLLARVEGFMERWGVPWPVRVRGWLASGFNAITPMADLRRALVIYGFSVVIWGMAVATNAVLFRATDLQVPPQAALMVLVLIFVGVTPGLMPTNIGPFYFMASLALQLYGVDQVRALAYAALLHLVVTGVPVAGALLYLWRSRVERIEVRRVLAEPEQSL